MATRNRKRYRATNAEMHEREELVYRTLEDAREGLTIQAIAETVNLPYPKVAAIVRRLTDSGRIKQLGRDGRTILFAPADRTVSNVTPTPEAKATPRPIKPVAVNDVLNQIHLGSQIEVIGMRLEDDGPVIDLRSPGGNQFRVTLVEAQSV